MDSSIITPAAFGGVDNHTQQQLNDAGVNWQQVQSYLFAVARALNTQSAYRQIR